MKTLRVGSTTQFTAKAITTLNLLVKSVKGKKNLQDRWDICASLVHNNCPRPTILDQNLQLAGSRPPRLDCVTPDEKLLFSKPPLRVYQTAEGGKSSLGTLSNDNADGDGNATRSGKSQKVHCAWLAGNRLTFCVRARRERSSFRVVWKREFSLSFPLLYQC